MQAMNTTQHPDGPTEMDYLRQELYRLRLEYEAAVRPIIKRLAKLEIEQSPLPLLTPEQAARVGELFRVKP